MATTTSGSARPEIEPTRIICDCAHDAVEQLNAIHDELGMDALLMMDGDSKRARRMSAAQWDELAPERDLMSSDEIAAALSWSWEDALALAFTPTCVRTLGLLAMDLNEMLEIDHVPGCPKSSAGRSLRVI